MNFTDMTFIVVLTVLTITGYCRGFLRTIIGPMAFIAATAAAFFYFQKTHNAPVALGLGIFGPILLGWFTNMILDNTILRNKFPNVSWLSQITGALFNFIWGGLIFLAILAALIIIPLNSFGLGDVNDNARTSMTYKFIRSHYTSFGIVPPEEAKNCLTGLCSMSEQEKNSITTDKDVQEIMNDPRVLKLISDPQMQAAMTKQDVAAMMSNPIVLELGQDPAFIAKALRVYPKIRAANSH